VLSPESVFACYVDEPAYHFAAGESQGDVGLGSALTLQAENLDALSQIEHRAEQLLQHCFEAGLDAAVRPPRFIGGLAFDGPPAPEGHWQAFPQLWFQLPRFRYLTDSRKASVTLVVLVDEILTLDQRKEWVNRTIDLLTTLEQPRVSSTTLPRLVAQRETPDRDDWIRVVKQACDAMKSGALEKVVLAREIELTFDAPPSVEQMLKRLAHLAPETTRFAFRRSTSTFLGATPERLVMRFGTEIRTEALAGSIRASDIGAAEELFHSEKDRAEHEYVVREIERKLCAFGARVDIATQPQIRQHRQVYHLYTPIRARLLGTPHVLTLAAKLHPTPAVGGVPEPLAREFIRRHECFERGFYAGAIGWFDATGDGEFLVALRSGLLQNKTFRLYAGAGIVADSDPEREFDETLLKFESLLDAIGHTAYPMARLNEP
jgi:isochorismate synthase